MTITPHYDLNTNEGDFVVTYAKDKTDIKLTASADIQEITISHQVDEKNRIAPSFNSYGDISVEWERKLSDTSSVLAKYKYDDTFDVTWKDGDWVAAMNMPTNGADIRNANICIKRDVRLF